MSDLLNILVIHGYVQSAATVAANTVPLRTELADIATLTYVDGPPLPRGGSSRPWWILGRNLEHDTSDSRWQETVRWWSEELSKNQYDGVIGLSQGSAMTGLLVSMLNNPDRVPGFKPTKIQPLKFAIFCSGFVSHLSPHKDIYGIPRDLPTLHTVDDNDFIVPSARTVELKNMCNTSIIARHNEGHSIPVRGDWPKIFKDFIVNAVHKDSLLAGTHPSQSRAHGSAHAADHHAHIAGHLHPHRHHSHHHSHPDSLTSSHPDPTPPIHRGADVPAAHGSAPHDSYAVSHQGSHGNRHHHAHHAHHHTTGAGAQHDSHPHRGSPGESHHGGHSGNASHESHHHAVHLPTPLHEALDHNPRSPAHINRHVHHGPARDEGPQHNDHTAAHHILHDDTDNGPHQEPHDSTHGDRSELHSTTYEIAASDHPMVLDQGHDTHDTPH